MTTSTLRDALLVIVSTRPINLAEEAERSLRLSKAASRNLIGRAVVLNAAQGDLSEMFQYARTSSRTLLEHRSSSTDQERLQTHEERRLAVGQAEDREADASGSGDGDGDGGLRR